jgi:hypothetical protein
MRKEISTREVVRRSVAAKKIQELKEKEARDLRRTEEATKGAKVICNWLESEDIPFGSSVGEQIVEEARRILHGAEQRGTLPAATPQPNGASFAEIIKHCRPKLDSNDFFQAHLAELLALGCHFAFSDPIVRDRALGIALDAEIRGRF